MRIYLTLLRREFASYFASLTGYVILATIVLLLGFTFLDVVAKLNAQPTPAPLTEVFYQTYYFWLILLLMAPVITMRLFALEKFSGTYETLMTAPVKEIQVVLAKFTGALVFYALAWLPMIAYALILYRYTDNAAAVDAGTLASTFAGVLLIGSVYMAMGCFASALTRSQMIAAIISYGLGIALFVASLRSLTALPPGRWTSKVLTYSAMTEHMEEFARGVVDTRHLVFYLTLTLLFLFLTVKVVESRRWN